MRKITLMLGAFLMLSGSYAQIGSRISSAPSPGQVSSDNINSSPYNFAQREQELINAADRTEDGLIRCFSTEYNQMMQEKYKDIASTEEFEAWIAPKIAEYKASVANGTYKKAVITVPVIMHIIHNNNEGIGTGRNISNAQATSQITILNDDFRRLNADTVNTPAAFQPVAADLEINFVPALRYASNHPLAGQDLAEPGINRVSTDDIPGVNNTTNGYSTAVIDSDIKPATYWDRTEVMNIWVCQIQGGILGYAQFPSNSGLGGMPGNGGAANTDGLVLGYTYTGTGGVTQAPFNRGRTATHEIGHWAGLRHIWGDGACGTDDYCNDTPESDAANYGCTQTHVSCGTTDMVQNYMDYSDDACMNLFTEDQKARVITVFTVSPGRSELPSSTLGDNLNTTAQFTADVTTVNVGGSVNFTDQSVSPDNILTWNWTFTGGTPNSHNGQTPPAITYNTPGQYTVELTITDDNAGGDTETKTQYINVVNAAACDTLLNIDLVNDTLTIYGTQGGQNLVGWNEYAITDNAEKYENYAPYTYVSAADVYLAGVSDGGNGATVTLNVWDDNGGVPNQILGSAVYNLSDIATALAGNGGQGVLNLALDAPVNVGNGPFYIGLSYAGFNENAGDSLGIVSNRIDNRPNNTGYAFFNGSWSAWSSLIGGNLSTFVSPYMSLDVPNATITTNTATICETESVNFDASSSTGTSGYSWVFNGGNPANSTNTAETVSYATQGNYWAYLVANGECGGYAVDSVQITVNPGTTPTFTQVAAICSGDALSALPTTSNNGITGTWSPALDNTQTTQYTFTPNAGQCGTTTTMTITVNQPTDPTFTQVAPICTGDNLDPLPTTSNNGVTGSWSPAMDNTQTTTYTFTPDGGQCANSTQMTINVNSSPTAPTFTQVADICSGDNLAALPTSSNEGVTGSWSPALDNTQTTQYTFTPDGGQCATSTTMTITVNQPVTPTFTQVADICSGDNLSALPTTSNNGVSGTWSPALDNTQTTQYTFTPANGECANTTTMTITVNQPVTPTFTQVADICSGDNLSALPTTSNNGVSGTWSPALDNTQTTQYTFTPNGGQCAGTATMTITVNQPTTPTFTQVAPICSGDNLSALPTTSNNGVTGTWSPAMDNTQTTQYTFTPNDGCSPTTTMTITVNQSESATVSYAQATYCQNEAVNPSPVITGTTGGTFSSAPAGLDIDPNTGVINVANSTANETYVVTYTTGGACPGSDNTTVSVVICPGIAENASSNVKIYPVPATSILSVRAENIAVGSVKLINMLGETLINKNVTSTTTNLNVERLALGVYFVQLLDNNGQVILTEKVSIK